MVTCAGDGGAFYATDGDGSYFLAKSTNAGGSWTTILVGSGPAVACSLDGTKLAATGGYVSTNSGATFVPVSIQPDSFAWSGDGCVLAAATRGIYLSHDNGLSWTITAAPTNTYWSAVALSADGKVLVAAPRSPVGPLYVSTDSGATWKPAATPTNLWGSVVCSLDGHKLAAVQAPYPGSLYVSLDAGANWLVPSPTNAGVAGLAASADGGLLLTTIDGFVSLSRDFGVTWRNAHAPRTYFQPSLACSADATALLAVVGINNQLAVARLTPALEIQPMANALTLSWPWPSSRYALQQSSDLSSMSWGDVTNNIIVTNYRNQVVLSRSAAQAFYRLQGPNP
ncbi:MAG TPA: sialidase family protein [Verrucomicrobiae bacterium]|jgi:photosystem II stability/assembly factor-like uncharacterized protein|nr:sialidase family protein [Verrucomicrobiae bacterium]